jgi:hypothetical protein
MTHACRLPLPDPAALEALAAQLRVWLLGVLAWLIDITGAEQRLPLAMRLELAAEIASARDEVFDILAGRLALLLRPQRRTHACAPAHGDPHWSGINARRAITRTLIARPRSLSARIRVLIEALANMDALVRRAVARIAKGARGAWIVVDTPDPSPGTRTLAPAPQDSS